MPTQPTYPGIYIEEISSGVRPITGVSTSVAAFVDFFPRGPVKKAIQITSFGDFQRVFGGLDKRSEASYAIQQFYLNGGQLAWVIRVEDTGMNMKVSNMTNGGLLVKAHSPGVWAGDNTEKPANGVQYAIEAVTDKDNNFTGFYNLAVREVRSERNNKPKVTNTEIYRNLSFNKSHSRYILNVVNEASSLIKLETVDPSKELTVDTQAKKESDIIGNIQKIFEDDGFLSLKGGNDGELFLPNGDLDSEKLGVFSRAILGFQEDKTGIYALDDIAPFHFNILCLPAVAKLDDSYGVTYTKAIDYCEKNRAFVLIDLPEGKDKIEDCIGNDILDNLRGPNAAVYFPRIEIPDVLNENRLRNVGPSGTLAGIYSRTDATRGVWKAPAGTETLLKGASVPVKLNDLDNGRLNVLGINGLRNFPVHGTVSWGARTLDGADMRASEWKYIPVRRTALFIEESLVEGLKWVVFEPNDEPLWAQIRLNVGAFMHNLFRQGAFQGQNRNEAYSVKCDSETTNQTDINNGIVNIQVGFAPLKPAEFVIIQLQQMAGQILV